MRKRSSKVSGKRFKQGQYLSCKAMEMLKWCAERHLKALDTQHWETLRFMQAKTESEKNGQTKVLQEISKESREVSNCIGELLDIYVSQFPDGRKDLENRK